MKFQIALLSLFILLFSGVTWAEEQSPENQLQQAIIKNREVQEQMEEAIDDIQWFNKLDDIAYVDKAWLYSTPIKKQGNKLKFFAHVFIPKNRDGKIPLIVFAHGGLYGAFQTKYAHIMRELIAQGYAIVAPEYRGSRGFGGKFKQAIDKGGKELADVHMAREFMLDSFPFIDDQRVGIMGWSFGGHVAAMSAMLYPEDYQVAFSGNLVSNLLYRMSYKNKGYQQEFVNIIGKTHEEAPQAYLERSPVGHVENLKTPFLIHSTTSDKVVKEDEILTLVEALKKAGKKFEFKMYDNLPGDHSFERLYTRQARDARVDVYQFLAQYLKPANPFNSSAQLVDSWITK